MRSSLSFLSLTGLLAFGTEAFADTPSATNRPPNPGLYNPLSVPSRTLLPVPKGTVKQSLGTATFTGKLVVDATISIVSSIPTTVPIYCGTGIGNATREVVATRESSTTASCALSIPYDVFYVTSGYVPGTNNLEPYYVFEPSDLTVYYGTYDVQGISLANLGGEAVFPLFDEYKYYPYTTTAEPSYPPNGTTTTIKVSVEI
jgi:hypothetical protein